MGKSLKRPPEGGLRASIPHGKIVYKHGSATGPTLGEFSQLESIVKLHGCKSRELMVVGRSWTREPHTARSADAGAVVFNEDGEAVGMVVHEGRSPLKVRSSYMFVTPIEDVLEDIKEFSEGGDYRHSDCPRLIAVAASLGSTQFKRCF